MNELFSIDLFYQGKEYSFEVSLVSLGYTHRFFVLINGIEVFYEPDEERKYRAILKDADQVKANNFDIGLIRALGEKIEEIKQIA